MQWIVIDGVLSEGDLEDALEATTWFAPVAGRLIVRPDLGASGVGNVGESTLLLSEERAGEPDPAPAEMVRLLTEDYGLIAQTIIV